MKVLFVLVDALKSLYLNEENMPRLKSIADNARYYKRISAGPGFCERSEIFSGLNCFDSGYFTAIGFDENQNEYKNKKGLIELGKFLEKCNKRIGRYAFSHIIKYTKCTMKPYLIPFQCIGKFALTEDGEKKYIRHEDLFDVLDREKRSYTNDFFTSLADKVPRNKGSLVDNVKARIEEGIDFIPVYIGEVDSAGHMYGNDIASIRPILKAVDETVGLLYDFASENNYAFALLGDHGMVPVTETVDIIAALDKTDLKLGSDYDCFFDSTVARFWFHNERAKRIITDLMKQFNQYGFVVNEKNYVDYGIPLDIIGSRNIRLYGDLLWFANTGVLISPDYFHSKRANIRGMHGYLMNDDESCFGQFIISNCGYKNELIDSAPLTYVCTELSSVLGVSVPNSKFKREMINNE